LHRNSRLGETAEGRQAVCVESICSEGQTISMIAIGQMEARDSAFSKAIQIKQLGMLVENNVTHSEERLNSQRLIFNTILLPVRAEIYII
jgi:hypothetical protein